MSVFAPGAALGPYLIQERIGAGGMGAVWKARDTRLDRTVAIKTIEGKFTERFEREAKAIASLNHPHICTLHDVGDNYLVMEFIDGQPVKGPLPVADVVRLGAQIADALDAAHRKGITHRDLKPGNVLVTKAGAVKVIDFGLAKAASHVRDSDADVTLTKPLTSGGMILGTVPYMSPEQLHGQEADARSDIFALGCVLYEMLTGKRAFEGKSQVSIMAAILEHEPAPLTEPVAPAWLDRIIRRCLRKNPEDRWQSARDIAIELLEPHGNGSIAAPPARTPRMTWVAIGLLTLAVLGLGWSALRAPRTETPNHWMAVLPPEGASFLNTSPILSPDGRMLTIPASKGTERLLYVRRLDLPSWRALAGTDDAGLPFWSPDSRHIGFVAGGKLRRVDLAANQVRTVCAEVRIFHPAQWSVEGQILFAGQVADKAGIYSVAESGGQPVPLPGTEPIGGPTRARLVALPDSMYLFSNGKDLFAGPATNLKATHLGPAPDSNFWFAPGERGQSLGHLIHGEGTRLLAKPFDTVRMTFGGEAIPIVDGVDSRFNTGVFLFSTSMNGAIAYVPATRLRRRLQWVDRAGRPLKTFGEVAEYDYPRISPDGRRVAYSVRDADSGAIRAFTAAEDGSRVHPVGTAVYSIRHSWSPSGDRIASLEKNGVTRQTRSWTTIRDVAGTGIKDVRLLEDKPLQLTLMDWSRDGKFLLYTSVNDAQQPEVWAQPLDGGAPAPVVTGFSVDGAFAPNGRYLAYARSAAIEVRRFPSANEVWRIFEAPTLNPVNRWRGDGGELFFLHPTEGGLNLMTVPARLDGAKPAFGEPKALFEVPLSGARVPFDVSPDGQRFLFVAPVSAQATPAIHVITNWRASLGKPEEGTH